MPTTHDPIDPCPRCAHPMPDHLGALSRTDNETYICPACGHHEAMESFTFGAPLAQDLWYGSHSALAAGGSA